MKMSEEKFLHAFTHHWLIISLETTLSLQNIVFVKES